MKRILTLIALLIPLTAHAATPTTCVTASPTADTSAYASGDLIGGELTFPGALRAESATGYIASVEVIDLAAQAVDLDLVIFSADATATTFTDQAALDIADGDLAKVIAVINLGSSSRFSFNDNSVHYLGSLFLPVYSADSGRAKLFGALVSRGSPTFGASDLTVRICTSQD